MHKKKWTEYLLEFFMLFLAVFLGFLAENQREHTVEANRAKEYAKSFISDLKGDTAELHAAINAEKFRQTCMDSIVSIFGRLHSNLLVPGSFYYYSRFVSDLYVVDWNSSTINQLVHSGNLRYFENKELVDKINSYYAWQNLIIRGYQVSNEIRITAGRLRNKILQSRYYSLFAHLNFMAEQFKHIPSPQIDSLMNLPLPLNANAAVYIDEYINHIADSQWKQTAALEYFSIAVKLAEEIMKMLKKEYHLQ
ncbi:MAG: hypothetical protein ICV66_05915 [Chitinophagaceae bacterium]|nr:hypothetical protein [Chitinophagaceae bacterium]